MSEETHSTDTPALTVSSYFVRNRNVLMAKADFGPLFVDYYLHLADHKIQYEDSHSEMFKNALAAFTLHCISRPRRENISWTFNFQDPLLNLFLAGDTDEGTVTGRIFTENVKVDSHNSFYQELIPWGKPAHRSYVEFTGDDPLLAAERYYEQSEQRPARFLQTGPEEYMILSAHPDYEEEWFKSVSLKELQKIEETEELGFIEKRSYRWHCGCDTARILKVLTPMILDDIDHLFQGDPELNVNCPRCSANYVITREQAERVLLALGEKES